MSWLGGYKPKESKSVSESIEESRRKKLEADRELRAKKRDLALKAQNVNESRILTVPYQLRPPAGFAPSPRYPEYRQYTEDCSHVCWR